MLHLFTAVGLASMHCSAAQPAAAGSGPGDATAHRSSGVPGSFPATVPDAAAAVAALQLHLCRAGAQISAWAKRGSLTHWGHVVACSGELVEWQNAESAANVPTASRAADHSAQVGWGLCGVFKCTGILPYRAHRCES